MLHNHENCHHKARNHQTQVDIVRRERQFQIAHHRKSPESNAGTDAPYRNILGRNREDNPHAKGGKSRNGTKGQENTESGKHTLASTETSKASEAMTQNHQQARHHGEPCGIILATSGNLRGTHLHGNPRAKEPFEQIHEHHGERRLPAQHAERVGETRILGTVVPNVEILTFRDFCYPNRAGDRPQQVRYRKTQQTVQVLRPF